MISHWWRPLAFCHMQRFMNVSSWDAYGFLIYTLIIFQSGKYYFLFHCIIWRSEVAQSCVTLYSPMDCSFSGSSVHGIFQARVLELLAISFFRGSSWPGIWTWVSHIAGRCFTLWATREAHVKMVLKYSQLVWSSPSSVKLCSLHTFWSIVLIDNQSILSY